MKIDRLKNSKPFHFGDVIIYSLIILTVLTLFAVFIFFPRANNSSKSPSGFIVENNGKTIISHLYGSDKFEVDDKFLSLTKTEETEYGFLITIYSNQDKTEFNVLKVNENKKTVKMVESNCRSKQCTYLHEVGENGIIYCAPRNLKITPITGSGFIPPIAG